MGKLIEFIAAMLLTVLLLAAQLYPASPLFWVASVATTFTDLRYALVFVLLWLLIHPPKTKLLRVPLGLSGLLLAIWLIGTTYRGTLGFIDFLTLSTATVALLTALLESKPKEEEFRSMRLAKTLLDITLDKLKVVAAWSVQFGWLLIADLALALESFNLTVPREPGFTPLHRHRHA